MERFVGIEEARGSLGRLVDEVATSGDHIAFTKRGRALAVLVGRDEYAQLKQIASERAREELRRLLAEARQRVEAAGVDSSVIEQAIAAARQLT